MAKQSRAIKAAAAVTLVIVVSKLVGFVRDAYILKTFGQSLEKASYDSAFKVVSVFTLFLGVGIGSAFIPIYTKSRIDGGELRANEYASGVVNLYVVFAVIASALGFVFAPRLARMVWDPAKADPAGLALITRMIRVMLPSLVFWAVTGVLANLLNARKQFIPEQLMGFALSACVITACAASGSIESVAVATSLSAVLQVIILSPFLRGRFRYKRTLNFKSDALKRTFLLAVPAFITISFDEINSLADNWFASGAGPRAVSALTESYRIVAALLGVLVVPVTTVMFSRLSGYAARKEMREMKNAVRKSIEIVALITLPVIAVLFLLQSEVIALFYERGNYRPENTAFTAPVFALYAVGIFAFGLRSFLTRVFYALQKTKIPMIVGIFAVGLNILLDFLLVGPLGARGLTLATSVAGTCGAFAMLAALRKTLGRMEFKKSAGQLARILACTAACAAAILLLNSFIPARESGFARNLARISLCGGAGLCVYALLARALRVETAGRLAEIVKEKIGRKRTDGESSHPA